MDARAVAAGFNKFRSDLLMLNTSFAQLSWVWKFSLSCQQQICWNLSFGVHQHLHKLEKRTRMKEEICVHTNSSSLCGWSRNNRNVVKRKKFHSFRCTSVHNLSPDVTLPAPFVVHCCTHIQQFLSRFSLVLVPSGAV